MKKNKRRKDVFYPRFWIVLSFFFLEAIIVISFIMLVIYAPLSESPFAILIVLLIYDIILGIFIANTKSEADFKISWLTIVLILPFVGGIIYCLFANKMTTKRMRKNRFNIINNFLLTCRKESTNDINEIRKTNANAASIFSYIYNHGLSGVYQNTKVDYFSLGELGFPVMLKELQKAKKFIFIEYFIIEDGLFFNSIYSILKQKAKDGVEVRFIYDDFGSSMKISSKFYKKVRKDGIQCYAFNRIRPSIDIRQNSRDHRKILVIDGTIGFTGGINLADEYINKGSKYGEWKDNCLMLKGHGVEGLTNLFLSNWNLVLKKDKVVSKVEFSKYSYFKNKEELNYPEIKADGFLSNYGEVPFDGEETSRNVFLQIISRANKYVYISTPYLIIDEEINSALAVAAKSGVNVTIITPGIPDKKIVNQITKSYYAYLLINGVKIVEYTPGFNHQKMILSDDNICETGTINFDFRSLYLHFENGCFMYNVPQINEMKLDLEKMINSSNEVDVDKYVNAPVIKRIYWSFLRILAPLM
ncbi:MAG: cardiolipin synthase [Bacilli bacterium]